MKHFFSQASDGLEKNCIHRRNVIIFQVTCLFIFLIFNQITARVRGALEPGGSGLQGEDEESLQRGASCHPIHPDEHHQTQVLCSGKSC